MFVCPECGEGQPGPGFCRQHGVVLAEASDRLLGSSVGSYRVARELGRGGMGTVYLGVHPSIGSRVAIKVLTPESTASGMLVERFFAEARAVNLIRNENIVNVLDLASLPDGRPYIVMEYLDGVPLSSLCASQGPLPLGALCRLAGDVLDALSAAHDAGVVHRDLKPDNVFVTAGGRAKVLDFGIAKLKRELDFGSAETRTGSLLGTPHYMSPEQARGAAVDSRSDLYSLGVILFEAAAGRRPFEGNTLYELLRQQVEAQPPPLRALRPDAPPAFEAIVARALEKDPVRRFGSAREFADALAVAATALPAESWNLPTLRGGRLPISVGATPVSPGMSPYAPAVLAPTVSGNTASAPVALEPVHATRNKAILGVFVLLAVALFGVASVASVGVWFYLRQAPGSAMANFSGDYRILRATNPGSNKGYAGDVSIAESSGDYRVVWKLASGQSFSGVGLASGSILGVGWTTTGPSGVVVYELDGTKLRGRWLASNMSGVGTEDVAGGAALSGTYTLTGKRAGDGVAYSGTVRIIPQGSTYDFEWNVAGETYAGVGIRDGDRLVVGWGSAGPGVIIYRPMGSGLSGRWAQQGDGALGSEDLTRLTR